MLCRYCNRAFGTKQLLNEHELIHTGVRIKCDYCTKDYSSRKNQQRHMRTSHNNKIDKSTNTLWSVCKEDLCCSECRTFYPLAKASEYFAHLDQHQHSVKP